MTVASVKEALDSAEEYQPEPDPIDALVERVRRDPAEALKPDAVMLGRETRQRDPAEYHALRERLKSANPKFLKGEFDRAMKLDDCEQQRPPSQTDVLLSIAEAESDIYRSQDDVAYADIYIAGRRETYKVRSRGYRRWLRRRYFRETNGAPSSEAEKSVLGVLDAIASDPEATVRAVYTRVGEADGRIYLDLCDSEWRAVEIDASGFRLVETPACRFRRDVGSLPLPAPTADGSIDALRPFLNVANDDAFIIAVAWLLGALRPSGPYPLLNVSGEQGSAKSTLAALLQELIDPNVAALRNVPRDEREAFISAQKRHVQSYDNASGLSASMSDALCRIATGGSYTARELFSDDEEALIYTQNPQIITGISDVISRPDLADRSLTLALEAIPENERRPVGELREAFEAARPAILGALLAAVSNGLKRLPETKLDRLPRMADFAKWAVACETTFWEEGAFLEAFDKNRVDAIEDVIEADPVASAVVRLASERQPWIGTASDLLTALEDIVGDRIAKTKSWPKTPQILSGRLKRAATFLRARGVESSFRKEGRMRRRVIEISNVTRDGDDDLFADRRSADNACRLETASPSRRPHRASAHKMFQRKNLGPR